MSAIIDKQREQSTYHMDKYGSLNEIVELECAIVALSTQKRALVSIFKNLLAKVALAQALGRHENWEKILEEMVKPI